jgi:hypothetical protein
MTVRHLSPSRLFVAGFLLFLVMCGILISGVGPLVALLLGETKAASALLVVGLGTGIIGGFVFGSLLASMGRTKTVCLPKHDPGALQLAHECLAKQGYTVCERLPSETTYCAEAAVQTYARSTALQYLSIRLFRFIAERLCGIVPAAFLVQVIDQADGLQVSGPAQCVRKVENYVKAQSVSINGASRS